MKLKICFLVLLCPFFWVNAQEKNKPNKPLPFSGGGLTIGQQVPDVLIKNVTGLPGSEKKSLALPISAFKGKLLILDFWATWCAPCIAMMPKMESLQQKFDGRMQFLPVAYQTFKEVDDFYKKLQQQTGKYPALPLVAADTILSKLFPHQTLPHYVWIDEDGLVKAITDNEAITEQNITTLLSGGALSLNVKKDEKMLYDTSQSLFFAGLDLGDGIFRSQLSGYITDIGRGIYKDVDLQSDKPVRRITGRNLTIPELFRIAYKKEQKETLLEGAEARALEPTNLVSTAFLDWLKQGRGYCYELMLNQKSSTVAYSLMQEQLKGYFSDYYVALENRKVKTLALVRTSSVDKIHSKGASPSANIDGFGCKLTNCFLSVFIERLQVPFQSSPLPLIDQTGYKGMIDLELSAKMTSVEEVNKALARYDLRFEEKPAEVEMLIIRKR